MTDSGDLVLDGAPSGLPPAISEALDDFEVAVDRAFPAADVERCRNALRAAILSALPREEPQPTPQEVEAGAEVEARFYYRTEWPLLDEPAKAACRIRAREILLAARQFGSPPSPPKEG